MAPGRWVANIWLAVCVAAVLLCARQAVAMTLVPPPPLSIAFESRTARLTQAGLVAVDELAARAAQCPATGLVVRVQPARAADRTVTQRRMAAVRARLLGFGLKLRFIQGPLVRSWSAEDASRPRADALLAEVGAGDDVWCDLREGSQIFGWAHQLGRFVEGGTSVMPAFWQQMSMSVRLQALALPLAKAAYCDGAPQCNRHPALYTWLAEQALPASSIDVRRDWLLALWTMADDAEVEAFRSRWALLPLTVEERASGADWLVSGALPWAVIERRLMEPGLMPMFGGRLPPQSLLYAATQRGELDSFDRLLDAAGPTKSCLVVDAFFRAVGDEEHFEVWRPHFGNWARGVSVPYQEAGRGDLSCNPAGWILRECAVAEGDEIRRVAVIWKVLRQAGITTDSPAIQALKTPDVAVEQRQCELPPRC